MKRDEPAARRGRDEPTAGSTSAPKAPPAGAKAPNYAARVKNLKKRFPKILARLAE